MADFPRTVTTNYGHELVADSRDDGQTVTFRESQRDVAVLRPPARGDLWQLTYYDSTSEIVAHEGEEAPVTAAAEKIGVKLYLDADEEEDEL